MRDEMIINNTKLIYVVLKRWNLFDQREHYYSIGLIGLIRAVDEFDINKGVAFSTFAVNCIQNEVLHEARKLRTVKRKADVESISLDEPILNKDCNDNVPLMDTIANDFNMEDYIIEQERREILHKAISTLKDDEQKLIKYYYYSSNKMRQAEIAKALNISQAHVSRKLKTIIEKLQRIIKYDEEVA